MVKRYLQISIILLICTAQFLEPSQLLLGASIESSQIDSSQKLVPDLHGYETKNVVQPALNQINVSVTIPLLQRFSPLALNNVLAVQIKITTDIQQTALDSYSIEMPAVNVIDSPPEVQRSVFRIDETTTRMTFTIPSQIKQLTLELGRTIPIWTILYRSYATLIPFVITTNIPAKISYTLQVILLEGSKFLSGYPTIDDESSTDIFNAITQNQLGQTTYQINYIFPPIKVAWEPKNWERNAILLTGFFIGALILLFLTPGQLKRRSGLRKISAGFGKIAILVNKIFEKIVNGSTSGNHIKLLLALSMIMVSLPLTVGEDPRTNILVLASLPIEQQIELTAAQTSNTIRTYTVADERNDLPVISRLQFFDAIIIGDYFWNSLPMTSPPFEIQALEFIQTKIILDQYKSSKLANWILNTYANVRVIRDQTELSQEFTRLILENEAILEWESYVRVIQTEALLSLLITILLVTSIIAYLMETNDDNLQSNAARTIVVTLFAFTFLQSVFFSTSSLLIPLSTHTGGSGITAISYLGPFGGGSMPRLACAMLGFIFAFATAGKKYGVEISWKLFLTFAITGITLFFNPVTGGQFIWNFLLDLTGGDTAVGSEKSILSHSIGALEEYIAGELGSGSSGFYRSRGIMLFFAGITPLLILKRARKYTTTTLIFICTVMTSWGAMRLGQMLAYHFFASILPGIAFGMLIALPFLMLTVAEERIGEYIRLKVF